MLHACRCCAPSAVVRLVKGPGVGIHSCEARNTRTSGSPNVDRVTDTTFAPILISFSFRPVSDQSLIGSGAFCLAERTEKSEKSR